MIFFEFFQILKFAIITINYDIYNLILFFDN